MMDITFERFLEKKFEAGYNGLDDDMEDAMDVWMSFLDGDDKDRYANEYGKFMYQKGLDRANEIIREVML